MKTCASCGLVNPDNAARCDCGFEFGVGDPRARLRNGRVAGFWIRLGSDLLDALVLGVVGWLITLVFRQPLSQLGERGVFVGLPISLLYSGVLQSRFGGGQTIGKRLLHLRVVRLDGSLLSLDRSLVRWGLLGLMVYGSAVGYALLTVVPALGAQNVTAAMGGLQLAMFLGCAVLVPFHPLKRGLHDLLTGSMVVRQDLPPAEVLARAHNPRRDRRLVIAAGVLAAAASIAGVVVMRKLPASLTPATRVMQEMQEMGVQNPGVVDSYMRGTGGSHHRIIAAGFVPGEPAEAVVADVHRRIVELIRKEMPLDGVDQIGTQLRTGVNIGIFSSYESKPRLEPVHAE